MSPPESATDVQAPAPKSPTETESLSPTATRSPASTPSTTPKATTTTAPPQLECDYDVNPTYLYQAIEAAQWEHCKTILVESTNKHEQTCTWVVRKEPNGKLRWRLLPLHAAVIFKAPLDILETLLQEYPTAAQLKDDQGMLPLHLAFRNAAAWDIVEELLTAHPTAIHTKDRKGRIPVHCATSSSQMAKPASVLELYTQIALGAERQRNVQESRTLMEARIGALQETHVATLTNLKTEWEQQQQGLQVQLDETQEALRESHQQLLEARQELVEKQVMEEELTLKLTQVTEALQRVTEAQQSQSKLESTKTQQRERLQSEHNEELVALVQTLMEQNFSIKAMLQKSHAEASLKLSKWKEGVEIATHPKNGIVAPPPPPPPSSELSVTDIPHASTGLSTPSLRQAGPVMSSDMSSSTTMMRKGDSTKADPIGTLNE